MSSLRQQIPGEIFSGWDVIGIVYGATSWFVAPIIGGLMYSQSVWRVGSAIFVVFFLTGTAWLFAVFCRHVLPANTHLSPRQSIAVAIVAALLVSAVFTWRHAADLVVDEQTNTGMLVYDHTRTTLWSPGSGNVRRIEIYFLKFTAQDGHVEMFRDPRIRAQRWLEIQQQCGEHPVTVRFRPYRKLRGIISVQCLKT